MQKKLVKLQDTSSERESSDTSRGQSRNLYKPTRPVYGIDTESAS